MKLVSPHTIILLAPVMPCAPAVFAVGGMITGFVEAGQIG